MNSPVIYSVQELTNQRLPGVSSPMVVRMNAVLKVDDAPHHFRVGAEWIASRLAAMISLPVPPAALTRHPDGRLSFVSLQFGGLDQNPAPITLTRFAKDHPHAAAGAALFDLWLGNIDRNEANVAVDPTSAAPVLFDHASSFDGGYRDRLAGIDDRLEDLIVADTLLLRLSPIAALDTWRARIERIAVEQIADTVMSLVAIDELSSSDARCVESFLVNRRNHLADLVASCRSTIGREGTS